MIFRFQVSSIRFQVGVCCFKFDLSGQSYGLLFKG
jgi:hypothetical protein